MRPRKVVLICCASEFRLSLLRFQLDIWGYRVISATSMRSALALLRFEPAHLVLLVLNKQAPEWKNFTSVCDALQTVQAGRGDELRIYDPLQALDASTALCIPGDTAEVLRQHIRMAVSRKRGPKSAHAVAAAERRAA